LVGRRNTAGVSRLRWPCEAVPARPLLQTFRVFYRCRGGAHVLGRVCLGGAAATVPGVPLGNRVSERWAPAQASPDRLRAYAVESDWPRAGPARIEGRRVDPDRLGSPQAAGQDRPLVARRWLQSVPHFFAPHTAAAVVTAVCGAKKCWGRAGTTSPGHNGREAGTALRGAAASRPKCAHEDQDRKTERGA
jgi:hypothetical protein